MTDQATRVVAAGWYEDPASPSQLRWWNGLAWTEHTALKPTGPALALASPMDDRTPERIAEARELERRYGVGTPLPDGAAAAGSWQPDAPERGAPRTTTGASWFIALWPVLTALAVVIAGYLAFYVWRTPRLAGIPVVWALVLLPYALTVVAAIVDVRRLRASGSAAPGPLWSLLGPFAHLVARRRRVAGSGPLAVFSVTVALVTGGVAAALLTGAADPVTKALEIQETVGAGLVGSGVATSVTCPALIESTSAGTLYTCEATLADGTRKAVWVSIDRTDGTFSYALSVR